jgi:acetylornithine deacetylase/succinyl-diaminopimelate desuccinylase-like protein
LKSALPPGRFSAEHRAWFDAACAHVRSDDLRRLVTAMTAIPSPAGNEATLAAFLVRELAAAGLESTLQTVGDTQANAVARRAGNGGGPSLMLYAPIDLHLAGNAADDGAWIDFSSRADLVPEPTAEGDYVIGLGAENPKGHAACVVAASVAIARAGIPLRGDLIAGLGGGGMPVNASPDPSVARSDVGHGAGCAYMLEHGYTPDFAVIAKPGGAVAYEEVGLCWFEIGVRGDFNYAGIGLRPGERNAVVDAATVVSKLQAWFPSYTARNTSGLVAPKGCIGAIEGGWPEKPAFVPEICKIYVDLRISPRTQPRDAQDQLDEALDAMRAADPGLRIERTLIAAIPGTSTPPENWIVRSCIEAWEMIEGRPHAPRTGTSGATDANVLRAHGIPTARIGMGPLGPDAPFAGRFSMGVVDVPAMERLTHSLIAVAIDTCTRAYAEVGMQRTERK